MSELPGMVWGMARWVLEIPRGEYWILARDITEEELFSLRRCLLTAKHRYFLEFRTAQGVVRRPGKELVKAKLVRHEL